MKSFVVPAIAASGVIFFGWNVGAVSPITNPAIRQTGLEAHDESSAVSLLGQFRTNISAWLWVRTDLYLHNGVQMRPLTETERKAGIEIEGSKQDGHEALVKEISITTVASPERDFRGIVGDVDRAVNAWHPMKNHTHNDPVQALPLFRLMTWLDPQFIEGWTTGAMVLARDRSPAGTEKALNFLGQGLAENPESVDLLTEVAYIDIRRLDQPKNAIPLLERARKIGFEHQFELSDAEQDALRNTYRWLALCYRDTDQPEQLGKTVQQGLSLFPDDGVLKRLSTKTGSQKGDNTWREAEQGTSGD